MSRHGQRSEPEALRVVHEHRADRLRLQSRPSCRKNRRGRFCPPRIQRSPSPAKIWPPCRGDCVRSCGRHASSETVHVDGMGTGRIRGTDERRARLSVLLGAGPGEPVANLVESGACRPLAPLVACRTAATLGSLSPLGKIGEACRALDRGRCLSPDRSLACMSRSVCYPTPDRGKSIAVHVCVCMCMSVFVCECL